GEPLFGVTVVIKGTTNGAATDFDGKFEIKVEPGTYDIQASFVSYKTLTVSGVEVVADEVIVLNNLRLKDDVEELGEVIVTADVIRQSESALLTVKKKSINVIDGISSENFKKIGDSDAGSAAKRVTGVSVEGGKYVYVRGLGDRYTKTTLNGLDIPGLDPDRNSIQIDVFPTNLIDNLVVLKSFTPDLPADFTGGIVNIETKDFPDEKIFDVSASFSFNPSMHFNNDYLTYEGSSTDFLGFDNGERALPGNARIPEIPNPFNSTEEEVGSFLNQFSPTLGAINETSFADYSLSVSYGDQITVGNDNKLGFLFSGNYKNTTEFFDEVVYGEWQNDRDPSVNEFQRAFTQRGALGRNNVLLGGMAGLAYKTQNAKYKFNYMRLQNGESSAGQFNLSDDDEAIGKSGFIGSSDNLEYVERSISNAFVNGEHHLNDGAWTIDWRASATSSKQDDPDIRKTAYTLVRGSILRFLGGGAGNPKRIWRELDEVNYTGKVDITRKYFLMGRDAKLKFGASHVYKERDYAIFDYDVVFSGSTQPVWTGDAIEVWTNSNVFPNGNLYLRSGVTEPNSNQYNASVNNTGIYALTELSFTEQLKSIIGLRAEKFVQRHTGRDQQNIRSLDNEKVLDKLNFFPSLNLIYGLNDDANLRFSYSRTIARPSFKELSFAQILDPVSNRTFNGGLIPNGDHDGTLVQTDINNIDLRWERFMERGQLLSVSAFYKSFQNPIELVLLPAATATTEFQSQNVGNANLIGVEFEFRKSLEFISAAINNFSLTGNLTLVESSVDIADDEFRARNNNAREGEEIEATRNMQGQAPWIINAGLAYSDPERLLDAGLYYNVKGATLVVVGGGVNPDVFSEPFHSLNFNLNKTFGAKENMTLNFSVNNILNDKREQFFQREGATEQLYESLNPGTSVGVGFKYSF
ncbi:MAG: TonB-dependent receptor, partial [Bacteroidota bacterium]